MDRIIRLFHSLVMLLDIYFPNGQSCRDSMAAPHIEASVAREPSIDNLRP